jgi:hypothetical protein
MKSFLFLQIMMNEKLLLFGHFLLVGNTKESRLNKGIYKLTSFLKTFFLRKKPEKT